MQGPADLAGLIAGLDYSPAPESAAAALQWLENGERRFGHFIGGRFTDPGSDLFHAVNPHNGQTLGHFTQGSEGDVAMAFEAARRAFPSWARRPAYDRARILYAFERQILKDRRILEVLESLHTGKPFRETRLGDIPITARHFGHHAALAMLMPYLHPGRKPGGVVAKITAWNFPFMLLGWGVAPAIGAGNTIVVKPGDTTPITPMYFAELCQRVGLPPGVVNIVTGNRETGKLIVANDTPWKISFTGSTAAGRAIREATAGRRIKLTMELGGKSAMVVMNDADLDSVVEAVVCSILFNKGEVCCALSRLIVQEAVHDRLVEMLKRRFARIRVGDPLDKCTDMGPQNSQAQFDKIEGMIRLAVEQGAEVWQPSCELPTGGFYTRPTLLLRINPDNPVARDEVFGPVLAVFKFRTTAEAIKLANNSEYGLSCSVWSYDIGRATHVANAINAGTRWVNCVELFDGGAGFGGVKQSGYGREGGYEGIYDVTLPGDPNDIEFEAKPSDEPDPPGDPTDASSAVVKPDASSEAVATALDLDEVGLDDTYRFLIGGAWKRPDGCGSFQLLDPDGRRIADLGEVNRKDLRDAVSVAVGAQPGWAVQGGDLRRKVFMFMVENLRRNRHRLAAEICRQTGFSLELANAELSFAIERLFVWASWADNYAGTLQPVADPKLQVVASNGAIGVIGIRAPDEYPLLGLIDTIGPAVAMGNAVVVVAGRYGLTAMTLAEIIKNSDVPAGVVNIVTSSSPDKLAVSLAKHGAVRAIWSFGDESNFAAIERASARNMKRVWTASPQEAWPVKGYDPREALRHATQVMNTWVPFGA